MNKRIRKKKGLSKVTEQELWSLDVTLAKYIYPRLVKYNQCNIYSFPATLESMEEWKDIIDKMIYSFDVIANEKWYSIENKDWIIVHKEQEEKVQTGLKLFVEHYFNLWI